MPNFDLSSLALASVCPGNEILVDDVGLPSVMVKIPKMTYGQLGMSDDETNFKGYVANAVHPAFIVNGQEVDAIYISKFQNIVYNGRAYSLPGVDPAHNITFDNALKACEAKGEGWHLMTRMEWGALVRWCVANGKLPNGNNNWGRHNTETNYKAIPTARVQAGWYDSDAHLGEIARVATGTGPLSWSHDGTPSGIWDLCGNAWEWNGGIRSVKGEIQVLDNNNAADAVHSQGADSTAWQAINATDGTLVKPDGSGTTAGTVKVFWTDNILHVGTAVSGEQTYKNNTIKSIVVDDGVNEKAKQRLIDLGMLQGKDSEFGDVHFWMNPAEEERMFNSGCRWYDETRGGLPSWNGDDARSLSYVDIGFRSAFVKLPAAH